MGFVNTGLLITKGKTGYFIQRFVCTLLIILYVCICLSCDMKGRKRKTMIKRLNILKSINQLSSI